MSDPTKIQIKIWGICISAEGVFGAGVALIIVLAVVLAHRF